MRAGASLAALAERARPCRVCTLGGRAPITARLAALDQLCELLAR
ncbi:MAG TPA: hypothetical protein VME46_10505 [Acidimicrobiales bacterium]|nr:hypothetical protein [Acidimicrobiales bacterium]